IEEYSNHLAERGVLIAKTVFDTFNKVVPLRFINLNSFPTKLYRKETVAECHPVVVQTNCECEQHNDRGSNKTRGITLENVGNLPIPDHMQEMYEECVCNLSGEEEEAVKLLLLKHSAVFSMSKSDLGNTDIIQHRINTGLAPPIRLPQRRVPMAMKEAVDAEVQRLIDTNLVVKSKSPWAFPLVPIRKKDNSIRICVDYRKLNEVTLPDSYPLPRIRDCLDALEGAKWFSTLDCTSGFFQVQNHPSDMDKTAFVCSKGLFAFRVMPMGLVNSPATYQRLMQHIMSGLQYEKCLIYLDDCIV
ncbi:MAG: reverse transcriptase family protein, partial [Candidatus Thiodiazotropha endolucinida]|nr:reverse transcriptase family protein [Candidatus Thiodiazotropha taylori]MCW4250296.1 reverse transcriptase family protein [Candidatus Thiodiazotropha endolucinida]